MRFITLLSLLLVSSTLFSQGLKTQGKVLVNSQGEEVLLRGLGPGGWQIMEGYMMKSSGFAGSQHEIKEKLIDLMGEENTETFFAAWRANHFTKRDVDSLAAWGFNSIRIPMHYNLFTLPIEDEPIQGENTWIETGFDLIDDVLQWAEPHGLYVILDLHAAPGGQGFGSEINDYDPLKSSLWDDGPNVGGSQKNKDKTVALWTRIAERFKDNEWIGGYDLINETHWDLPGGTELRQLFQDITTGIRSVDTDHILFIEGNSYANDYTGLEPPWDTNMVYSFHKYWNTNNENDLDWVLPLRERTNVPLWMGESGENSNTWFTDAITLFENNNIGWAWWTIRKIGDIDSPYAIDINPGYQNILDYWNPSVSALRPTEVQAFDAMMQLVENLSVDNSKYRKDLPDAMFRQVQTDETIPYSSHIIPGVVYLSDYDLGKNQFAYYDVDVADDRANGGFQAWNSGWSYRNDGVDIETNDDVINSNGYHIGFTTGGEWTSYTVQIEEAGTYSADVRLATDLPNTKFHLSIDDQSVTSTQNVSQTGGWASFTTHTIDDIILKEGEHMLKIHFDQSSVNVGSIEFSTTGSAAPSFAVLTGIAGADEKSIELTFNKALSGSSLNNSEGLFTVKVNGLNQEITGVLLGGNDRSIQLAIATPIHYSDLVSISYEGQLIMSESNEPAGSFQDLFVINNLPKRFLIPGKIEAEDFYSQSGLGTEETTDVGEGRNIGFTDFGDYADYRIFVRQEGVYRMDLRVASDNKAGNVGFYLVDENANETELVTIPTPVTGGWQTWQTVSEDFQLTAGIHTLRMKVLSSGFNLNWFSAQKIGIVSQSQEIEEASTFIYPNPTDGVIRIPSNKYDNYLLISLAGSLISRGSIPKDQIINFYDVPKGLYILNIMNRSTNLSAQYKIIIEK